MGTDREGDYRRGIRAWILYDWANSAFATTCLAAVLPVFYTRVAGATLPSASVATGYWTLTLSLSLAIVAVLAPVLGTMADVTRGKKRFLGMFVAIGVFGTVLLTLVGRGDWLLASAFFVIGRVGFASANVFYDSLLPHVARPEDQDRVSTQGYAFGYLGGGLLLAANVLMLATLPAALRFPLTFLSVAAWWSIFSLPLFRHVPEPFAAPAKQGASVLRTSFRRLGRTFRNIRRYRQLFRFLIAFLIYNDGIGTIIGVAAIYGSELGFRANELITAILLVQFVGIPFSLVFGRIASGGRRAFALAFVVALIVLLPVVGLLVARVLPADVVGSLPPQVSFKPTELEEGESVTVPYQGRRVRLTFPRGPGQGMIELTVGDTKDIIKGERETVRTGEMQIFDPEKSGDHRLVITARDGPFTIEKFETLTESRLGLIFGLLAVVVVVAAVFALTFGRLVFGRLSERMDAKRAIALALIAYGLIAFWGFLLGAVVEFWFLAFMISVVQGGSQALSRSLYAAMSPKALSGEFFGLFSVMAKFSAIVGPLFFTASIAIFGGSRPAMLGVMLFFVVGLILLRTVDVEEGRRVAKEEDERALREA